jgi:dimethylpropiothetin dethiomethylase
MVAGLEGAKLTGMDILSEQPDWLYLLREYHDTFGAGSSGGSNAIRSHRRRVREQINRVVQADPPILGRQPEDKPVTAHLGRALDLAAAGPLATMAATLRRLAHRFTWEWGYERVPRPLTKRYAYCELAGPNGPVQAERIILGLVLLAPGTTYPQHSHKEIEESYVSLAGAWSENDTAVYAPGSLIFNQPEHAHRITVGERAPCLLAYAWLGPPERLKAPGMTFGR